MSQSSMKSFLVPVPSKFSVASAVYSSVGDAPPASASASASAKKRRSTHELNNPRIQKEPEFGARKEAEPILIPTQESERVERILQEQASAAFFRRMEQKEKEEKAKERERQAKRAKDAKDREDDYLYGTVESEAEKKSRLDQEKKLIADKLAKAKQRRLQTETDVQVTMGHDKERAEQIARQKIEAGEKGGNQILRVGSEAYVRENIRKMPHVKRPPPENIPPPRPNSEEAVGMVLRREQGEGSRKEPCYQWVQRGQCRIGYKCRYRHDEASGAKGAKEWAEKSDKSGKLACLSMSSSGKCKKGDACGYSHDPECIERFKKSGSTPKFKSSLPCYAFASKTGCKRDNCTFAHTTKEK